MAGRVTGAGYDDVMSLAGSGPGHRRERHLREGRQWGTVARTLFLAGLCVLFSVSGAALLIRPSTPDSLAVGASLVLLAVLLAILTVVVYLQRFPPPLVVVAGLLMGATGLTMIEAGALFRGLLVGFGGIGTALWQLGLLIRDRKRSRHAPRHGD